MSAKQMITAVVLSLSFLMPPGVQLCAADMPIDDPKWQHDPFRYTKAVPNTENRAPKQEREPSVSTDNKGLKGIFVRNGSRLALYDGQLVTAGARIGTVLIREIARYSIVIEDGAGRRRIDLFHENQGRENNENL